MLWQQRTIESAIGINCYRDVGGAAAVVFILTPISAVAIAALAMVFDIAAAARRFFSKEKQSKI